MSKDRNGKPRSGNPGQGGGLKRRDLLAAGHIPRGSVSARELVGEKSAQSHSSRPPRPPDGGRTFSSSSATTSALTNVSAYSLGLMGYRTPNIDRIAREGMMFTDYYAEQSCTAGRSAFLTGQATLRTGLSKVGLPAAQSWAARRGHHHRRGAQAARLRHRPVRQEPPRRPQRVPADRARLRRVLRQPLPPQRRGGAGASRLSQGSSVPREVWPARRAQDPRPPTRDDPTVDPRFGKVGKQKIEDTGPLTKKRMETIDDETGNAAVDFMQRQTRANKPFFLWWNGTRMHAITHVRQDNQGKSGISEYVDGMLEHDGHVGQLLKSLDDLGIANDTIVVYTTDNGPHMNTWPDGAMTPFRGEKNTNWEGAFRVPAMVRWPNRIRAGAVSNEICCGPRLVPDTAGRRRRHRHQGPAPERLGHRRAHYKVHLDGFNQVLRYSDRTAGQVGAQHVLLLQRRRPAHGGALRELEAEFLRAAGRGHAAGVGRAVRVPADPQAHQPAHGPLRAGTDHLQHLPRLEFRHAFLGVPTQEVVAQFMATFKEFPPRRKPASFSVEQVMRSAGPAGSGKRASHRALQ